MLSWNCNLVTINFVVNFFSRSCFCVFLYGIFLSWIAFLWQQLAKFIDKNHSKFKDFLIFHVNMCRLIVILILVPQVLILSLCFEFGYFITLMNVVAISADQSYCSSSYSLGYWGWAKSTLQRFRNTRLQIFFSGSTYPIYTWCIKTRFQKLWSFPKRELFFIC